MRSPQLVGGKYPEQVRDSDFRTRQTYLERTLVIGGYAAITYGIGWLTKDIDLFVPSDVRNAERLLESLKDIEFGTAHLIDAEGLFAKPITIFNDYFRVDVLTSVPGLDFEEAWARRTVKRMDG